MKRKPSSIRVRWRLLAVAVAVTALASCARQGAEALMTSAKDYAAKGDYNAAAIQLKNVLQQNPDNGEARLLLGQALLETGDAAGAEKELRRALQLKQAETAVAPLLARSLYETRQFDALAKEFAARRFDDPAVDAQVRTYVGEVHLARGAEAEAADAFAAALRAVPGFAPARLGAARLALREQRLDDALRLADEVIAAMPRRIEAYLVKADVQLARGDPAAAQATLQAAIGADAAALPARLALVSLLLDKGALEAAAEQLEAARKTARADVRLRYFDALLAFRRGDMARARENALQVLKHFPDNVPALVLGGAIELQAGQASLAEDYLRRALARAPAHGGARRLLVAALLRSGQPTRALEALQPLVGGGDEAPAPLLLLAGETYLANGDLKQAASYFERAAKLDGHGVAARTRLAQIAIARGDTEFGLRELEAASQLDPNQNQADIALVLNHLRRGNGANALAAARALADKQPRNPVSFQVLGSVQLTQKDRAGARASFERALALDAAYLPAAVSLSQLDLADKKPEAARHRFAAMLAKDPKNEQILLAQAEFEARAGAPAKEVMSLLRQAVAANPQSTSARIALVNYHLRSKDARAALVAAQEAAAALPNDPRVVETLALAQEAVGETKQAVEALQRLAALRPGSVEPLAKLAALHARTGSAERAIETLRRAKKLAPENRQIDRDLVAMLLAQGKPDEALRQARELQTRAPKYAGGYVLEGDVLLAQKKFADAERAYRAALKIEPAGVIAGKLIAALHAGGKAKEADEVAARWLADQPRDTAVRLLLADRALRQRDLKTAAAHYTAVVGIEPNNVVALNNLAWVGGELGDPKAVAYAERAATLAPNSASVLDTLGMLLVKRGDAQRGLRILEQARQLAPARFDLRLNHARALVSAGQKEAARKELQAILDAKEEVAEKRAAAELLKTL